MITFVLQIIPLVSIIIGLLLFDVLMVVGSLVLVEQFCWSERVLRPLSRHRSYKSSNQHRSIIY